MSSSSASVFLKERGLGLEVKAHPVVLFSIVDHYSRRNEDQTRVVGILLGHIHDGIAEVRNSFPVPFVEPTDSENPIEASDFVDDEFLFAMYELNQKTNPGEVVIGWYSTGAELDDLSVALDAHFKALKVKAERSIFSAMVHITVDTSLKNDRMSIKAYTSVPLGYAYERTKDSAASAATTLPAASASAPAPSSSATSTLPAATAPVATTTATSTSTVATPATTVAVNASGVAFMPLSFEVKYHEAERVGVNLLQRCRKAENHVLPLLTEIDHLESTVLKLQSNLGLVAKYVENVISDKIPGDAELGHLLAETVSAVPKFDVEVFDKQFNTSVQDLLMVMYLSTIAQTQINLVEKLASNF